MVPIAKKQKNDEYKDCIKEEVLFNTHTLSNIASYLPPTNLLNLALTCKRLGVSENDKPSLIEESADIAIKDLATKEQSASLPYYKGENALADYHYLQLLQKPLLFDQLVGDIEYVDGKGKSCVRYSDRIVGTAFSNEKLKTGKHYASFEVQGSSLHNDFLVGVMRPGQANQYTVGTPVHDLFYKNFSRDLSFSKCHGKTHCCMLSYSIGDCMSFNPMASQYYYADYLYEEHGDDELFEMFTNEDWEGRESMSSEDEIGLLLDLDMGTLSVYKNGRNLGVMKRGLIGPYCWVVSILTRGDQNSETQVTIKRGMR